MTFVIGLASSADGPSILGITERAGVFTPTELSCVEELWNAYRDKGEASGYIFLICRDDDGRPLGYATFGPHPLTQGTYDLYWIAVDPIAQGHGVGHALLAQVESQVLARGGRLLLIETSDTSAYASARRLYETGGYRCEATICDFYAPGDGLLLFAKGLTSAGLMRDIFSVAHQMAMELAPAA
jgi:GNAT superfamily N-acetyltransferase